MFDGLLPFLPGEARGTRLLKRKQIISGHKQSVYRQSPFEFML